jgi:ATP-dependent DNA helicase DinG
MIETIRALWSTACQDKPARPSCVVRDGKFVFTVTGNKDAWSNLTALSGVPTHATQDITADKLVCTWESLADTIFGLAGPIAALKSNYELRDQQLYMARMVQRAIEMNDCAMIEAGTGTGKGFAYLAMCMAMDKKVTVSTSNKALQSQLMTNDIPFLLQIFPGKRVALAQGKSNYACKAKAEDLSNIHLEGDLREWYFQTETGNMEEISFEITKEQRMGLAIDDTCQGRKSCSFGADCYYYVAKDRRETADIIVTNHALLCLNLAYGGAGILPQTDVLVVDEAHKLVDYARNALGVELTYGQLERTLSLLESYGEDYDASAIATHFSTEIAAHIAQKTEQQVGVQPDQEFPAGLLLATELEDGARNVWDAEILPASKEERRMKSDADKVRKVAQRVRSFSMPTVQGHTRWIEYKDGVKLFHVPYDVARFLRNLVGYTTEIIELDHTRCTWCNRKLTAQAVSILDGKPYGPDCIQTVDIFGDADLVDLTEWLGGTHKIETVPLRHHATIFTSATLMSPDLEMFQRETGVLGGMVMEVESPFDYPKNAMIYVPNGASPAPTDSAYPLWVIEEIEALIEASHGSAFLLFTSYANLRNVRDALQPVFQRDYPVFVQGEDLGKQEMARRFSEAGNGVLFGTKSFFEGVSIEGDALRLVVIDKMPFMAPNPINSALEADLHRYAKEQGIKGFSLDMYPFDHLRVPTMIIDLKQAFGRLIRTRQDFGTVAILDTRLRTSKYGRNTVLPALPKATMTHDRHRIDDFFAARRTVASSPLPMLIRSTATPKNEAEDFTL